MLLRLQNFDVTIKYCPGKEILVADALSRYSPLVGPEVALDIAIHHVHITPEKKLEFQRTIQDAPLLCALAETIVAGWPEDIKDVPKALCPYHNHCDVMTVEDRLILKGEAHHSTIGKGEDTTNYTQRTHGNHQVPVPHKTMCILAWNQ